MHRCVEKKRKFGLSKRIYKSNDENKGTDIDQSLKPKEEIDIVEKEVKPDSENQNTVSTNINRPSKISKRKNGGKVYHCKHCSECFGNKKILGRHLKEYHSEEEKINCRTCGEVFANKFRLQKHINTIHEQKGIVCQLCQNSYKSQACLKAHVRLKHETGGEKVCLICFQVLADDKDLKVINQNYFAIEFYSNNYFFHIWCLAYNQFY